METQIAELQAQLEVVHRETLNAAQETHRAAVDGAQGTHREMLDAVQETHRDIVEAVRAVHARSDAATSHAIGEVRDTVNLAAARLTLRRRRTRVLFLVHHIEAWDSYHELVARMRQSEDFEPVVVSCPRHFHGMHGFADENHTHVGLQTRGVPHLRLSAYGDGDVLQLLKAVDPDLIFRQSQWEADVLSELGTDQLAFSRLCLVPYETMNIVENVPEGTAGTNSAVDSRYHRSAWLVFCTNELMRQRAIRDGARGGTQFHIVGHPKADRLRDATPRWPLPGPDDGSKRPRVVWSAHHSIGTGWSDFGAFPAMAEQMLGWAQCDADTEFVFMPHPALLPYTAAPESPYSAAQMGGWRHRWEALPNTAVFDTGDYAPLLSASDLLVTDGLSMLVEYQLLARPIVFLERPGHRAFNDIGEIVRTGVHTVRTVTEARTLAHALLAGDADPLRTRQVENIATLFGSGRSVDRIMATLRDQIHHERVTVSGDGVAALH